MKQFIRNFHVFSVYRFNALHGKFTLFKPFSPSSYTVSQTSLRYFLSCDMLIIPPLKSLNAALITGPDNGRITRKRHNHKPQKGVQVNENAWYSRQKAQKRSVSFI